METSIGTISNHYGGLVVRKNGEDYSFGIEDYCGAVVFWDEIPKSLYDKLISYEKQRLLKEKKLSLYRNE